MSTKLFKKNNDSSIANDWAGFLGQYGIKDSAEDYRMHEKYQFLAEMAHNHAQFENPGRIFEANTTTNAQPASFFNLPGTTSAMGNPIAPTSSQTPFFGGVKTATSNSGSGDKFPSLLPISIQAAAKTIAFDLVSTINMDSPVGFIPYIDYTYQGGQIESDYAPFLIKLTNVTPSTVFTTSPLGAGATWANAFSAAAPNQIAPGTTMYVVTNATTEVETIELKYVGTSRVDGSIVFRVVDLSAANVKVAFADGYTLQNALANGSPTYTLTLTTNVQNPAISNNIVDLVSANENHISGFTNSSEDAAWSGNYLTGVDKIPSGMTRASSEVAPYRQMGIRMFTKFVEAKAEQVGLSATLEQIQDFNRVWNYDVIGMLEQIGVNEIAQKVSKDITTNVYKLGALHTTAIKNTEGVDLSVNLTSGTGGFENTSTMQRRLATKLIEMSNLIYHRSRWGAGEYVVTNGQVASALVDVQNYSFSPFPAKAPATGGQLYPAANVYGMQIYVDPNQKWGDNKILVGRKGKDEEPGVKFMPYIMAETVQTTSEVSGTPKLFIKSRFAITEAGWHPETQYITLSVNNLATVTAGAPVLAS